MDGICKFVDSIITKKDVKFSSLIDIFDDLPVADQEEIKMCWLSCQLSYQEMIGKQLNPNKSFLSMLFGKDSITGAIETDCVDLLIGAIIGAIIKTPEEIQVQEIKGALVQINEGINTNFSW